jgi:glycine/D-amino acid oxidase-like deaminating enzyme
MTDVKCVYEETAAPEPPAEKLSGEQKADVAIVGGGFTGLSSALHLAAAGLNVTVLEAHAPGEGASGRNGGQVNPGLKHDPDVVERDFGLDLGRRMVDFAWNAPNRVFDLIEKHAIACDARRTGTLRAAFTRADADAVRRTSAQCRDRSMPIELLEAGEIERAAGTARYVNAMLDRRGGMVNPLAYARGLAAAARRAGAAIHAASPATAITRQGLSWVVSTADGALSADRLVIATNAYSGDLWPGLRRSIVPVYSAIVCTAPLPDEIARRILPLGSVLYEHAGNPVYFRVDARRRLLFGGCSPLRDLRVAGDVAHLRRYALKLYPCLAGIDWTHCWNGQFAATADAYPHFHEPAENVLICLGYNGRGVAMSTAMGGEIARRILGAGVETLNMPLTSIRPILGHRCWKLAVAARLALGGIADFVGRR